MNHRRSRGANRAIAITGCSPSTGKPVLVAVALLTSMILLPPPVTGQERVPAQRATVAARPASGVELRGTDVAALLGSTGDERRISSRLRHRDRAVTVKLGQRLRAGESFEDIRDDWEALVRRSGLTEPEDVTALTQWVLREAYLEEVNAEVERLDAADDQQLTRVELQNAAQKQQQTMQTISNVSKSMHDTAKAMIQNMKG